jgi:hypothetical protein
LSGTNLIDSRTIKSNPNLIDSRTDSNFQVNTTFEMNTTSSGFMGSGYYPNIGDILKPFSDTKS